MSDAASRSLSRLASLTGSPHDQARVLVERLRRAPPCEACGGCGVEPGPLTDECTACAGTGSLMRSRVELAAYCGDDGARAAVGSVVAWPSSTDSIKSGDGGGLSRWVAGLSRWGVVVEVRAAVAAAEHAASGMDVPGVVLDCLDAARAWLAAPSESARMEWVEAWRQSWGRPFDGPHQRPWLPVPPNATPRLPGVTTWSPGPTPADTISACSRAGHEAPVREAIQRALVSWALGEEP